MAPFFSGFTRGIGGGGFGKRDSAEKIIAAGFKFNFEKLTDSLTKIYHE